MKLLLTIVLVTLSATTFCQDAEADFRRSERERLEKERIKDSLRNPILPLDENNKITYSNVVKLDSVSASVLYSKAKAAVVSLFVSGKDATQLNDDVAKQIIVKGFLVPIVSDGIFKRNLGNVWFTLTIQCKDGKYKYTITDFIHKGNIEWPKAFGFLEQDKVGYINKNTWFRLKEYTNAEIVLLIDKMNKKIATNNNDDF